MYHPTRATRVPENVLGLILDAATDHEATCILDAAVRAGILWRCGCNATTPRDIDTCDGCGIARTECGHSTCSVAHCARQPERIDEIDCYGRVTPSANVFIAGQFADGGEFEEVYANDHGCKNWREVCDRLLPYARRKGVTIYELEVC